MYRVFPVQYHIELILFIRADDIADDIFRLLASRIICRDIDVVRIVQRYLPHHWAFGAISRSSASEDCNEIPVSIYFSDKLQCFLKRVHGMRIIQNHYVRIDIESFESSWSWRPLCDIHRDDIALVQYRY